MNNVFFSLVIGGLLLTVLPASAALQGTMTGWCVDNGTQPYIYLEWGAHPAANSNGLQKGDLYPSDPGRFWEWLSTNGDQRSYSDYAIVRGVTYTYRVKYQPQLPSNEVRVMCGTPTPTPTSVPTPIPVAALSMSMAGRNVARGQRGEYGSVTAKGNETIEIILRVRNTSGTVATNVSIVDMLPAGIRYIPQSTSLNGIVIADGITTSGVNIGVIWPNQEVTVRLSTVVDLQSVPTWGQIDTTMTAQSRADNAGVVLAQLPIRLGQIVSIAPISHISTGPGESLLMAVLLSVIATGAYAMYTTTAVFHRRMALTEISRLSRKSTLNFTR